MSKIFRGLAPGKFFKCEAREGKGRKGGEGEKRGGEGGGWCAYIAASRGEVKPRRHAYDRCHIPVESRRPINCRSSPVEQLRTENSTACRLIP
jgi:hypothetical protein